jgi:uncharacterized protein YuzE
MLIKFDPAANAVYLTIHAPRDDRGRTTVTEDGLIIDLMLRAMLVAMSG